MCVVLWDKRKNAHFFPLCVFDANNSQVAYSVTVEPMTAHSVVVLPLLARTHWPALLVSYF